MKKEIFGLTLAELQTELAALGLQKFRASQVFQWLYVKSEFDFHKMTNLSPAAMFIHSSSVQILNATACGV